MADLSVFEKIIDNLRRGTHVPAKLREEAARQLGVVQSEYQQDQATLYRALIKRSI